MTNSIDIYHQQLLSDMNLYAGSIDGIIGPETKKAIKRFQMMNGLEADGVVGPNTKNAFQEQLSKNPNTGTRSSFLSITKKGYKVWPKEGTSSLNKFYGGVGKNQTSIAIPYKMYLAWDKKKSVKRITCHEKVADSLQAILSNVKNTYSQRQIEEYGFNMFGGCLNVRKIRGGDRYSTHSWGCAIDIDPARNQLKWKSDRAFLARPECMDFLDCFKQEGWYSLGGERNFDWMHFQACHR